MSLYEIAVRTGAAAAAGMGATTGAPLDCAAGFASTTPSAAGAAVPAAAAASAV
jgi:hypothetical protein